jgi:PKD repeat protein
MLRNLFITCLFMTTALLTKAQCNELFFSEYLEGSSNNKAIEIYNPTANPINLNDYVIYRYNNGSPTPSDSLFPIDILAPGDVWVAGNPSAIAGILAVSDTLHTITFYNGDDAMSLKKISTNTVIDIVGIIGNDPGASWVVGAGATGEFTLVRNAAVHAGTTNWAVAATQYDVYPQNTVTFLGAHTMTSCTPVANPTINFATTTSTVVEGNTVVSVVVNLTRNGNNNLTTASVALAGGGTASSGLDFNFSTANLSWAPNDSTSRTVTVTILNDLLFEASETVPLSITNLTNGATTSGINHVITITDNDFPTYPIGDINNVNALGVGDSIGLKCWMHGVVYGGNLRPTGLQFTMIAPSGGISVFNAAPLPGYATVTESDSILMLGTINQFNGLLQVDPDTIILINTGLALKQPLNMTTMIEAHESDLIRFIGGHLVNPTQWTGTGAGFNVDVTDGTNTVSVRIDADVNLYSMPAPVGIFNVTGLGSQFDNSSPYTSGYQFLPRYSADIVQLLNLELGPNQTACAGATFNFDAGPGDVYNWSNGATTQNVTISTSGMYYVTVTNTTYNVSATDSVMVTITAGSTASFTQVQNGGVNFNFTSTSINATTTAWDFGDGNTSTATNPSHTYSIPGTYTVTLIVSSACGADTTSSTVTATLLTSGCDELFFSEYLEGASNNKAIEIYNPGTAAVNLLDYVIYRYNNGSVTPTDSLFPQDILAGGDVWLAGNPSAIAAIISISDTLHTITFFNGDDALSLKKISTNTIVDVIGEIGVDPGTNWVVGTGATSEFTLVRKPTVTSGTTSWTQAATEYDVYPQNTTTFLGAHTMNPCIAATNPIVNFSSAATTVVEGNTPVDVTVTLTRNGSTATITADVVVDISSTATGAADYTYTTTTLTWLPTDSTTKTVTLNILDDAITEGNETVVLAIQNLNSGTITNGINHVVTITDNDYPVYPIGDINNVDGAGVGDSIGLKCWIHGVVYGVNLRATGLQFTVIDPTGGIGIFNGANFPGYTTVTETDSIHLLGTINQFNGLLQIDPDSIVLINTGNALKQPTLITALSEPNESDLLRFDAGWLANPAQWTGTGSGFNVDVTDGTNTIVVRIDNDVNLFSMPAPTGIFNVCGLGSQFDNASPYDGGYQLMPRYVQDIKVLLNLDLGPDQTICAGDSINLDAGPGDTYLWSTGATSQMVTVFAGGTYSVTVTDTTYNVTDTDVIVVTLSPAPVAAFTTTQTGPTDYSFANTSTNGTSSAWTFGDGNSSTAANPTHTYTVSGNYTVTLTVTGPCGVDTATTTLTVVVGISDPSLNFLTVYPNPSQGLVKVRFDQGSNSGAQLMVTDLLGRQLLKQSLPVLSGGEEVQLPALPRGVHQLEVIMNGEKHHVKLVIE